MQEPDAIAPDSHFTLEKNGRCSDGETIYWPTETGFQLIRGPAGLPEKGYYYSTNRFAAAEHGGRNGTWAPVRMVASLNRESRRTPGPR